MSAMPDEAVSADVTPIDEVAIIIPDLPIRRTLSTGFEIEYEELRARQFFKMLRILTRGAGPLMAEYPIDFNASGEELGQQLIVLLVMAIPEAEDEAIEFLKSMTKPAGLENARDDAARRRNIEKYNQLDIELDNPELEDLIDVITDIVQRESADLSGLGKRLRSLFTLAQKTGQAPELKAQPTDDSPNSKRKSRTPKP